MVKEADALSDAGFDVTVLYSYWNQWGSNFTNQLLLSKKWQGIQVGGHPVEDSFIYFISRVIFAIAKWVVNLFGPIAYFAELATSRSSYFLIRAAKKT